MTDILFQDKNVYIQRECDFKKSGYYQKYIKYKKKYIDLKNQLSFLIYFHTYTILNLNLGHFRIIRLVLS